MTFPGCAFRNSNRSFDEQKNEDAAKSQQTAGQDEDEYGGSTDEEPEEMQRAPTVSSQGKISSLILCVVMFSFIFSPFALLCFTLD